MAALATEAVGIRFFSFLFEVVWVYFLWEMPGDLRFLGVIWGDFMLVLLGMGFLGGVFLGFCWLLLAIFNLTK